MSASPSTPRAQAAFSPTPESVTAADRTLLASLPFQVEGAWDRGTLALLIPLIRDNDFHGIEAANFAGLTEIDFSPRLQHEHCLRAAGNDGAQGDEEALALCRNYILDELRLAATATPGTNVEVEVALTDETRRLQLPAFQVHLGRALHALEDSFAHSLREDELHPRCARSSTTSTRTSAPPTASSAMGTGTWASSTPVKAGSRPSARRRPRRRRPR